MLITDLHTWKTPAARVSVYEKPYAANRLPDQLLPTARRYGAVGVGTGNRALAWR